MRKILILLSPLYILIFNEVQSINQKLKNNFVVSNNAILTEKIKNKYGCPTIPNPISTLNFAFSLTGSTVVNERTIKLSNQLGREINQLTNQYRASKGLPRLAWDQLLAKVGRRHTVAMADGRKPFNHDGFFKRLERYKKLLSEVQPNARVVGFAENLFFGSNIPRDEVARRAVNAWIASPGHEANLSGNYNRSGVSVFKNSQNVWYITQLFALVR